MIINPTLTKAQIIEKISTIEEKLEQSIEVGDEISSMGATVKYNHRANHYKEKLEQLYAMLASKTVRGE